MIGRREMLVAMVASAALPAGAAPARSLGKLAAAKGIRFGSTIGTRGLRDPAYSALNARECALIVPENEMKWAATRPSAEAFDFRAADRIVAWAGAKGLGVRGHTLLWHSAQWFPKWLTDFDFGVTPKAAAERLLTVHVRTVAARYAYAVDSFDVVNEAIDPATGALRETSLSRQLGASNVLDLAFLTARAAAPRAELVYNDFMNWTPDGGGHRGAVLRLLAGFRKRGTPVDALGIQSHLGSKEGLPGELGSRDERGWRHFLDEVVAMNFKLLVTELDVHDNPLPGAIGPRDAAVADETRAYLDLMLSYPQLRTVMCWGLGDNYSWLQTLRPRADGLPKRPCPFDPALAPKPMRDAVVRAFAAAPVRA